MPPLKTWLLTTVPSSKNSTSSLSTVSVEKQGRFFCAKKGPVFDRLVCQAIGAALLSDKSDDTWGAPFSVPSVLSVLFRTIAPPNQSLFAAKNGLVMRALYLTGWSAKRLVLWAPPSPFSPFPPFYSVPSRPPTRACLLQKTLFSLWKIKKKNQKT